ncbi:hypothetical protein Bbelb_326530 [Branchiostoma belcheri]|nr:hypothetical protein Bbelb_326530 [Branchiostoma belcheri]
MSRSFTVRPANAKQQRAGMEGASPGRGAGRGRGRGATGNQGPSYVDVDHGQGARPRDRTAVSGGAGHQQGATGQQMEGNGNAIPDERFKRGDGYTLVVPNEKKRQSVLKQGQKELEAYQKHKESRRPANFSYVGTVGGPNVPEDEVRRQQAQEDRRKRMNTRDKREQYRQTQKQQEDKQLQMKKDYYRGQHSRSHDKTTPMSLFTSDSLQFELRQYARKLTGVSNISGAINDMVDKAGEALLYAAERGCLQGVKAALKADNYGQYFWTFRVASRCTGRSLIVTHVTVVTAYVSTGMIDMSGRHVIGGSEAAVFVVVRTYIGPNNAFAFVPVSTMFTAIDRKATAARSHPIIKKLNPGKAVRDVT